MEINNVKVSIVGNVTSADRLVIPAEVELEGKMLIDDEEQLMMIKKLVICPCDPLPQSLIKSHVDTSFRGGSRGKGGKVKWERK